MVLKKPSDFFDKNNDNSSKINREEVIPSKQEKLESIAENFGAFKNNSSKLSEFTETFNKFKDGFDKVEILSKGYQTDIFIGAGRPLRADFYIFTNYGRRKALDASII